MPCDGMRAVLIEVQVAAVGPFFGVLQTAQRHAQLHCLPHPRRERCGLYPDVPVAVSARARRPHHPGRLPWQHALFPFRLQPLHSLARCVHELRGHGLGEGLGQICDVAPALFVGQTVFPSGVRRSSLADQPQTLFCASCLFRQLALAASAASATSPTTGELSSGMSASSSRGMGRGRRGMPSARNSAFRFGGCVRGALIGILIRFPQRRAVFAGQPLEPALFGPVGTMAPSRNSGLHKLSDRRRRSRSVHVLLRS
mmetsp:Transcript_30904/g.84805  ORF Transcript_30904/g.84805 Transcript_30904/m.84805 type:complete len:256 (-) Transcript_30904:176-943(-)